MGSVKIKIIYIFVVVFLCSLAYCLGLNAHKTATNVSLPENVIVPGEINFDEAEPFIAVTYDACPPKNVPEEQNCVVELAETTITKADDLANKLIALAPKRIEQINSGELPVQRWENGDLVGLPAKIKAAQEARDGYFNKVCELDTEKIYGGTGMIIEFNACRYYYAKQYLEILKGIDRGIAQ